MKIVLPVTLFQLIAFVSILLLALTAKAPRGCWPKSIGTPKTKKKEICSSKRRICRILCSPATNHEVKVKGDEDVVHELRSSSHSDQNRNVLVLVMDLNGMKSDNFICSARDSCRITGYLVDFRGRRPDSCTFDVKLNSREHFGPHLFYYVLLCHLRFFYPFFL